MKSEADFAEIFEEETHTQSMTQLDDNVENISASVRAGAGIRLYKGTSSVYGYTDEMDMEVLEGIVDDLRSAIGKKKREKRRSE
ncbi:PmbA/TldA family metallopeptidase [Allobaculum sp. Allo2]|uniref:PmbA/TldA family metallopeptidase n=1 Tax=Allobaculum sp. Allo2 TaxID=2853432 RepID=UPI001F605663|nr:DNA gyrase modulator [Allobaculum sp. Allo2]